MEKKFSYPVRAMRLEEDLWHALCAIKYEQRITWNKLMKELLRLYQEK